MKKVLSIFLALLMILSICTVGVSAAGNNKIIISADVYHARKGDYAYFPVYYDCETAYSEYADSDENSSTKIILPFLYNDHLIKPVEAIPSEQLYNIGGTVEIIKTDKYVYEGTEFPYIHVEVNFDGCIDINNDVLFNVKFEVISENFFDEYGRLDMGGLFDDFYLVDDDNVMTYKLSEWKIYKSNGEVKDISLYVTNNSVTQFAGTTYEELLLKGYEPFIPPVEDDELTWVSGIKIAPTLFHVRKGNLAYYPIKFDLSDNSLPKDYAKLCELLDIDAASTHVRLGYAYAKDTLDLINVLPSKALYALGGTVKIVEQGLSEQNPDENYFIIEIDFTDAQGLAGEYLFNLQFEVLKEEFFYPDAPNIARTLVDTYPIYADYENLVFKDCLWEVTDSKGKVHDLSDRISTYYITMDDGFFDSDYNDLLIKDYEPFIPPVDEGKLTTNTTLESGKTYYINNYEDLKTLSYLVNEKGEGTQGVTFVQTKDIVANSGTFSLDENNAPLYNGSSALPDAFESIENFSGTFDGQNYTISGLYLNAGLFENCDGAEIKNIYIENSLVLNEDEASYGLGTISSVLNCSTIRGCSVDAIVIGKGNCVGGVVGKMMEGSAVRDSRNLGNVFGGRNVGGVAGAMADSLASGCYNAGYVCGESYVGGLAGCMLEAYAGSSYNIGDVKVTGSIAGGFAGCLDRSSPSDCYTAGKVEGLATGEFCGEFAGDFFDMFDMYCCYYIGDSIMDFDADGNVYFMDLLYQEYGNSIMYPPGSIHIQVQHQLKVYPYTEAQLKSKDRSITSEFVYDAAGENEGYPMMKYFHKEHTFSDYVANQDGTVLVAPCSSRKCEETHTIMHTHTWGEYTTDANGNQAAKCLDEMCKFTNVKDMTVSRVTVDPIGFTTNEGKIYNFTFEKDGDYKLTISAPEKAALCASVYLNGELVEENTILKWTEGLNLSSYYTEGTVQTAEIELKGISAGDKVVVVLHDKTGVDDTISRASYYLKNYSKYFAPSSVKITIENTIPLFEFGVTAQHIRNRFDMLYYPVSFGFSMYDDADIRYSDICADVADLAFGCDTEIVMKYIYDATTLDFIYVYDDSWNGSVEVLEHGSTGMTGDEGQEYNYIVLKAKFSAVGYANDKAPYYLKFAVVEDNFINSDGTVRKVIDNVPYSEDQLCVWNAWDHEGDSFDFSYKIKFKSSDYETDGYTYDNLLLEDDIIATDVDMPTVTFTPEHARKDDLAYYPCMYDANVDYEDWVRSAAGFKDSTTRIQIKVNYDSSTLELLDALPSKELYDLGGTVTIIETGDLYPDNPDYGHMKYAVVQLDFDALDFTDGCLFSLKFRVLQENFLDEEGRAIDLVDSFVADWVVTSNEGKSHDLRYYISSSYLELATFGSYEELLLADYEPFDPTLIEIEERFEIIGGASVVTQGGVNYIVGLQSSLTKAKFLSTYIVSENATVEINMTTARYLGTGSTVTVKSKLIGEVIAEYVVVIYGDVDGSATINGRDAVAVSNSVTGVAESLTGAAKLAANVEGTRATINAKDASVIRAVAGGSMTIDPETGKGVAV